MKLREYLEQFKGGDPDMEVFQEHKTIKGCVRPCQQQVTLALITKDEQLTPDTWWFQELNSSPNPNSFKGIVLY